MAKKAYVGVNSIAYTPVEYLESSGTQYIDTGVHTALNVKMEAEFAYLSATSIASNYMGAVYGGSKGWFAMGDYSAGDIVAYFCATTRAGCTKTKDTNYHVYYVSNGLQKIDESQTTVTTTTMPSVLTLYLFGGNIDFSSAIRCAARLKYCKIWEGDTLVRDYIPVKDANNVPCLFEKVENKFYYNQGTGDFSAGTEGTPVYYNNKARPIKKMYVGQQIPPYYELTYIESSGTQYIDTGVYPYNTKTEIKFQNAVSLSNQISGYICGAASSTSDDRYYCMMNQTNNSTPMKSKNRYNTDVFSTAYDQDVHTLRYNDNLHVYYDNVDKGTLTSLSSQSTGSIFLFCRSNGANVATEFSKARIYYVKITDNETDTLLRDLVPAIRTADNEIGMYDKVNDVFYSNLGTGEFIKRQEEETSSFKTIRKAYVGVNGVARLFWKKNEPTSERVLEFTSVRGYSPAIANTSNHIIVCGGANAQTLANFETWNTEYVKTTVSKSNFYKDADGCSLEDKGLFIFSNLASVQIINDSLTSTQGGTYYSGNKYGMKSCEVGGKVLFTGGGGGASTTAKAFNTAGTLVSPTQMSYSRYRHAQTNFNGRACIVGGGNKTMEIYDSTLTKTTATGLDVDKRYINSSATKNYLICGIGAYSVVVFNKNLVRLNPVEISTKITNNCIAFREPNGDYVGFLNDSAHSIVTDNLLTRTIESNATLSQDTYQSPWLNDKVAIAGQARVEIFDL